jgi:DNA-binding NtrC family response regulator
MSNQRTAPEDKLNTANYTPACGERAQEVRLSLLVYHREGAFAIPLEEGRPVVFGYGHDADAVVRDEGVSRTHARFELMGGEVWVTDLDSTNGTFIEGSRVFRSRVAAGQEVTLGPVVIIPHRLGPDEPAPEGLINHDTFTELLAYECAQSRSFQRNLALVMVHAVEGSHDLRRWCPRIQQLLRLVDRVALYSPDTLELLLPVCSAKEAVAKAETIAGGRLGRRGPTANLRCGIANFPSMATSSGELLSVALEEVRRATAQQPVRAGETASRRSETELPLVEPDVPIVESPATRTLFERVDRLATREIPVLIVGETGSGKELVARAIHSRGRRARAPLRCVNCGAIPEQLIESILFGHVKGAFTGADKERRGLFESAHRGTLLLDEIGELSEPAQAALLRVLDRRCICRVGANTEIPVDVRIIAATNRDLEQMCAAGRFRSDLLYRINGMTLRVPPLRERREDILPLARAFLAQACRSNRCDVRGITPEAEALLERHPWPGNVRELRNVIERAVALCDGDGVDPQDLPEGLRAKQDREADVALSREAPALRALDIDLDFRERIQRFEAELILEALRSTGWNQTAAAKLLRIPMRSLTRKIASYGIRRLGYTLPGDR